MKSRYTPYLINLVKDALLKSFWRKNALKGFLKQCGIADRFLLTWQEDETKRLFIDRLFERLLQTLKGQDGLDNIAAALMEQRSFPDLENWEDSAAKIKAAHDAVSRLRVHHERQTEELQSEEERRQSRDRYRSQQQQASTLRESLEALRNELDELSRSIGTQEAGYRFQTWFFRLLDYFEIPNRKPYVSTGRQIDGSLTLVDTTYLVELKFTTEQASAPDVDSFFRKVTRKADNTMGILVSMSGFSGVAIQEASREKTPILLMDYNHLYCVLTGIMDVKEMIDRIRRHASQTGEAYLHPNDFSL